MSKIGILVNSSHCHKYLYETIQKLADDKQTELFLLINKNPSLNLSFESGLFKVVAGIEKKILHSLYPDLRRHDKLYNLSDFIFSKSIQLTPEYSQQKQSLSYSKEDVDKISTLQLDFILKDDLPIRLEGPIGDAAKDGIISIQFEDKKAPPGFWKVYERNPAVGFYIEQLSGKSQESRVLFTGKMMSSRSYTENKINLFSNSYPFLTKMLLHYVRDQELPAFKKQFFIEKKPQKRPSAAQSIIYVFKTLWFFFNLGLNRRILGNFERWSVAFVKAPWPEAELDKGAVIKNPPNRFFADPFIISRDNRTICFVEDFDYRTGRGRISAVEILDSRNYQILGPVIEEPFHMSFPYLFEHQGRLYMVPETAEANSIRLYECTEFPLRWEFKKEIFSNFCAADPMIFKYEDKWWLLCNRALEGNADLASTLVAYSSDEPISGQWTEHPENPLIFDCNIARNGGILFTKEGAPVRGRQQQGFYFYGASLSLAKIKELSPSSFKEEKIRQINPTFFQGIRGCHHIHSNGIFTVYDCVKFESPK